MAVIKNKYALHAMVSFHSNMLSDIRLAAHSGFDGLEAHTHKLWRYLDNGGSAKEILNTCKKHKIEISGIGIIGDVEKTDKDAIQDITNKTHVLCNFAKLVKAPIIQLNAFCALSALKKADIIKITAKNIRRIADIGKSYNIKFQYEGCAWTPIHTIADCLNLINEVERNNFGLVIDFWHFWASRGASPEDIAKLDKTLIYGVHITDGFRPLKKKSPWKNEKEYRNAFPGKGKLPVQEWVHAIKATGYEGYYSGEFLNDAMWETDNLELSKTMYKSIKKFV